jgi:hypothetical protein
MGTHTHATGQHLTLMAHNQRLSASVTMKKVLVADHKHEQRTPGVRLPWPPLHKV